MASFRLAVSLQLAAPACLPVRDIDPCRNRHPLLGCEVRANEHNRDPEMEMDMPLTVYDQTHTVGRDRQIRLRLSIPRSFSVQLRFWGEGPGCPWILNFQNQPPERSGLPQD